MCNPTHGTKSCCSVLINKVKTVNCNKHNKGKTDKRKIADYVLDKKAKQSKTNWEITGLCCCFVLWKATLIRATFFMLTECRELILLNWSRCAFPR